MIFIIEINGKKTWNYDIRLSAAAITVAVLESGNWGDWLWGLTKSSDSKKDFMLTSLNSVISFVLRML